MTRYITDDLEISSHNSDESDEGQIKTKYLSDLFLTRMCEIIRPQKRIHKSLSYLLINSFMFKAWFIS